MKGTVVRHLACLLFPLLMLASPALAQAAECPDLTTLQRLAGYVTLLGIAKVLGACIAAAGFMLVFWGVLVKVIYQSRVLLEVLAYIASVALIGSGYWLDNPEYLTWTVFIGCLLFGGSVMATLWIHEIEGDDPKPLATFFMLVWGAVAVFYNMPEVGFLSVLALMTVLGFSVIVEPFCYAFGFKERASVPSATVSGILLLIIFMFVHVFVPDAPAAVTVFKSGVFWCGSFVAFIGLLIMSNKWYARGRDYISLQLITVVIYGAALVSGLVFAVNPLAGMAGTFLVLYLAEKPLEIEKDSEIGWGVTLIITGGILYGAWWYGTQYTDLVSTYLTTQL